MSCWQHGDYACGDTGFDKQFAQVEHGQRSFGRRLNNDRAAGGECRGDLAGTHSQREIPRRNSQSRADRLLNHRDARGSARRNSVIAGDTHSLLSEPTEKLATVADLGLGIRQRTAHLQGLQLGQLVCIPTDEFKCAVENLAALAGRGCLPLLLGGDGVVKRPLRVLFSGRSDLDQRIICGGINYIEGLAIRRRTELTAEQKTRGDVFEDVVVIGSEISHIFQGRCLC